MGNVTEIFEVDFYGIVKHPTVNYPAYLTDPRDIIYLTFQQRAIPTGYIMGMERFLRFLSMYT